MSAPANKIAFVILMLALPAAIIWATARSGGGTLITRDIATFPADQPDIRVPYTL